MTTTYHAQISKRPGQWAHHATRATAEEAAWTLTDAMQWAGFRLSELAAHRADLVAGHTLTSEHGISFRVVER